MSRAILFVLMLTFVEGKSATLDSKQESIVLISAFTANGDQTNLQQALHGGLDAGLTISEIKEVIVQLYAYAGFPRSLNALNTFMAVLKERKAKGINDADGKVASPYPSGKSKLEFGTENQTRLVGSPVKGEVYEFAPTIDQFLKEHLFGDIFGRDVLDYKTREIATIAALASMSGTQNQLRSHMNVGKRNGLTESDVEQIMTIIKTKVEGKSAFESNPNFTGSVSVNMLVSYDSIFNSQMATVTFEPAARTNWHYHPSGQILVITDGVAYYQEKGKAKQVLPKGQTVKCLPGIMHWHGASPNGTMTHLAMSPNLEKGGVVWLEKVTEEEYNK